MMESSPSLPEAPHVPRIAESVRIRIAGLTDVGRVREHNEDNFIIADLTRCTRTADPFTASVGVRGLLFGVCDGMGGAAAGEIASQMAVDVIHGIVQDGVEPTTRDIFAQKLVASVQEAGARIFLAAKSNRSQRGMGTTATVAGVHGATLFVGQVGDSRAYLLRGGQLRQLTKDQSLVSKLIEAGQLTEAEAETYEHSHIILQALGTADTVSVDLSYVEIRQGDTVLLCSDGLSGLITTEQIREALTHTDDPAECCQRLTDAANEAGGHDNVTVIVARFEGDIPEPGDGDLGMGYQPYVLLEPVEVIASGRTTGALKVPDLPPPGADVKHSISYPPDAPGFHHDEAPAGLAPRTSSEGTTVPAWLLVVLTVAAVAVAGWWFRTHHHGQSSQHSLTVPSEGPARPMPEPTVIAVPEAHDGAVSAASTP